MDKFTIYMENKFNKLETAYQMTILEESIIQNDYTFSVYTENDEDMDYFTEASKKVENKKKGIISKMVDWFKNLFTKIGNKILELFGKKATEYEIYDKTPKIVSGMKGLLQKIKEAIRKFGDSTFGQFLKFSVISTAVIVGICNIPRIEIWAMTTVKAVKADGLLKGLKGILEDLEEDIGFVQKKDNTDDAFSLFKFLQEVVGNIWKIIKWGFRPYDNLLGHVNKVLVTDPNTGKFNM